MIGVFMSIPDFKTPVGDTTDRWFIKGQQNYG